MNKNTVTLESTNTGERTELSPEMGNNFVNLCEIFKFFYGIKTGENAPKLFIEFLKFWNSCSAEDKKQAIAATKERISKMWQERTDLLIKRS